MRRGWIGIVVAVLAGGCGMEVEPLAAVDYATQADHDSLASQVTSLDEDHASKGDLAALATKVTALESDHVSQAEAAALSAQVEGLAGDHVSEVDVNALERRVTTPAGTVVAFAGSAAPAGWMLCDGQAVSRTLELFAAIGTTYGAGDGSTTFNLPDARGRTIVEPDRGANRLTTGNVLGRSGGAERHTLTSAEMPVHNHGVNDPGHTHHVPNTVDYDLPPVFSQAGNQGVGRNWTWTAASVTNISIQNAGGGASHNNLQPYLVLNWIIKL